MKYFISESRQDYKDAKNGSFKPREDFYEILFDMGYKKIDLDYIVKKETTIHKIMRQFYVKKKLAQVTKKLQSGDILFVQYPLLVRSFLVFKAFRSLKKRGIKIVLVIHDIPSLREHMSVFSLYLYKKYVEFKVFQNSNVILAHNNKMKNYLINLGIDKNKIVILGIFDYLIHNFSEERMNNRCIEKNNPIVFAGNLSPNRAGFLYKLDNDFKINIFGTNYQGDFNNNKKLMGSYSPEDLPYHLEGSFGLVWDGESPFTCQGKYGAYLKYNNPYKASMYLASDMPIVIWGEAALADFVLENNCGIVVSSLLDVPQKINNLSLEEYQTIKNNAKKIGIKIRTAYYSYNAIAKIENKLLIV